MESTAARKSKGVLTATAVVVVLALCLLLWAYTRLHQAPLHTFVKNDLPMLGLHLQFIDLSGNEVPSDQIRLAPAITAAATASPEDTATCPEIKGGDIQGGFNQKAGKKPPDKCPKSARWYVKRHPIGMSLSFSDPQKILALFEQEGVFKELWESRFVRGVLRDPLLHAGIRAEDFGLPGLEGAFLARLIKETIAAHGQLHYDIVHGRKGFVYSFVRNECAYAAKVLPVVAHVLARSGYTTQRLQEPILEMRIGLQRVFMTQYQARVYVANGLEALLNVLESLHPSAPESADTPIALTVRGEAFVDKLPLVMTGEPTFPMVLGFELSRASSDFLRFPAGKFARHLRPKVFKGIFAGIPHDVFAAAVTSFYLPPNMSAEQWQQVATEGPGTQPENGPEEGGLAVIWDLASTGREITNIGVVIASQSAPDDAHTLASRFAKPELTAQCGGGTVFLAATSELLLTRMREACERQSLSVLDWERGVRAEAFSASQMLFFLNPGAGMRELFLAGGAKDQEQERPGNSWQKQYEQAKAGMRADGERIFARLPIFTYSGNVAPTAATVQLSGMTVNQGTAP